MKKPQDGEDRNMDDDGSRDKPEELLVDESEVEEELEHLEEQKRRKEQKIRNRRRKRFRRFLAAVIMLLIAVGIIYLVHLKKVRDAEKDSTVTIEAADDEEIVYAKVTSIEGNDMSVSILKKAETGSTDAGKTGSTQQTAAGSAQTGEGTHTGKGQMSKGAGAPSDMSGMPTGMPGGGQSGSGGTAPSGKAQPGQMPSGGGPSGNIGSSDTQYTDTGKTKTYEIPVGTDVTTKLGTVTTFSRIAAEDTLAIVVKKDTDNIMRIYIQ
jgi:hypothetical protein